MVQDCETWVDMNLTSSYGMYFTTKDWCYVFREAAYGIWTWRNRLIHGVVEHLIPPGIFANDVITRVRESQMAFGIALL